jgi:OPA family sugar phosphate sensor protein UhpC-like MFS transporter
MVGSLFDLAGPVGTLAGGYLSDRVFHARRMPAAVIALFGLAGLMAVFPHLPKTRLAVGLGFFVIGFLIYIPDSLVSGTAAIDFGTRRGASTASGIINGCGSIGQTFGVTIPGWADYFVAKGGDIWNSIFLWLAIGLVMAGLLLLPLWNRTPSSASENVKS